MAREIELTRGYVALIDDSDHARVSQYKWFALVNANGRYVYAMRAYRIAGQTHRSMQPLAAFLLGVRSSHRYIIRYADENPLNCTRLNITMARRMYRMRGCKKTPLPRSSTYKGVCYNKRVRTWQATITVSNKCKFLGYYPQQIDAAHAYDDAARKFIGTDAALNFPLPGERSAHR